MRDTSYGCCQGLGERTTLRGGSDATEGWDTTWADAPEETGTKLSITSLDPDLEVVLRSWDLATVGWLQTVDAVVEAVDCFGLGQAEADLYGSSSLVLSTAGCCRLQGAAAAWSIAGAPAIRLERRIVIPRVVLEELMGAVIC